MFMDLYTLIDYSADVRYAVIYVGSIGYHRAHLTCMLTYCVSVCCVCVLGGGVVERLLRLQHTRSSTANATQASESDP